MLPPPSGVPPVDPEKVPAQTPEAVAPNATGGILVGS